MLLDEQPTERSQSRADTPQRALAPARIRPGTARIIPFLNGTLMAHVLLPSGGHRAFATTRRQHESDREKLLAKLISRRIGGCVRVRGLHLERLGTGSGCEGLPRVQSGRPIRLEPRRR